MIFCPFCDAENIEGADACDQCGQSLNDLHLPTPATQVEQSLLTDRVRVVESNPAIAVTPETPVRQVLDLMVEKHIGCVIVVDQDQRVCGIFSERDALIKINVDAASLADQPVSEFMTRNPQTLESSAKIAFAVHQMDVGSYRHLPIVDENQTATGVLSVRDILTYLTEKIASAES